MIVKNVEKKENNTAMLQVEIDAESFDKAINGAYKKLKGRINVPGFRKGKAPRMVIEGMFGADVFYEDAMESLAPEAFEYAVGEEKLDTVGMPSIVDFNVDDAKVLTITFSTELYPEVTLGQYKGLEGVYAEAEVTDEEVGAALADARKRNARFVDVDRPVQQGDSIVLDFEGFVDGVAFEGGKADNYTLEIGSGAFIPGFEDQLVGLAAGQEGEVKVTTSYYIEKDERNAGYPIMAPVVDIVEIGNGGGSIAWMDEAGSLKVGPKSAGALPGPVAYGKGGTEPTTTDANLIAGRLSAKNFDMEVDLDAVRAALREKVGAPLGTDEEGAAESIIRVADSNMNNALKLISVRRGYDPRDFTMVAFGGGGPMHGPTLAKELNIRKVVVPVAASVFSAWGMLMTDIRHDFIQTRITSFSTAPMEELNAMWTELMAEARAVFAQEGVSEEQAVFTYIADMRYMGQEHTVQVQTPAVPWQEADRAEIMARFHRTHEHFYTFSLPDTPAEIVNLHLVAYGRMHKPELKEIAPQEGDVSSALKETRRVFFSGDGWLETPIYDRAKLGAGARAEGPLVVEEPTTATVVCPGQSLSVDKFGNLVVEMEVE